MESGWIGRDWVDGGLERRIGWSKIAWMVDVINEWMNG